MLLSDFLDRHQNSNVHYVRAIHTFDNKKILDPSVGTLETEIDKIERKNDYLFFLFFNQMNLSANLKLYQDRTLRDLE